MIILEYNNKNQTSDIVRDNAGTGNILVSGRLDTAVMISLFTRKLVDDDETLPDHKDDRGGWWADPYYDVKNHYIGSKLWLLGRFKATQAVLNLAKIYAQEALQWLIDDGIAESVNVEVERQKLDYSDLLALKVNILKPSDPASKWSGIWEFHLADL